MMNRLNIISSQNIKPRETPEEIQFEKDPLHRFARFFMEAELHSIGMMIEAGLDWKGEASQRVFAAEFARTSIIKKLNKEEKIDERSWGVFKEDPSGKIMNPQPKGWPKRVDTEAHAKRLIKLMKTFGGK